MRTSAAFIACTAAAFAIGSASAFTFPKAEAFDTSLLRARSPLPDTISTGMLFDKRQQNRDANGPEDCGDDEEYVPYTDEEKNAGQHHDDDGDSTLSPPAAASSSSVAPPNNQHAVVTSSGSPESAPSAAPNSNTPPKDLKTPDNIAEGTYTVEEGCIRYYTPVAGDICLGLVEKNADVGLTLDQLYCLNPAIDDQCYNLWIGTSYCVGYGGSEPLNTGVSSKA